LPTGHITEVYSHEVSTIVSKVYDGHVPTTNDQEVDNAADRLFEDNNDANFIRATTAITSSYHYLQTRALDCCSAEELSEMLPQEGQPTGPSNASEQVKTGTVAFVLQQDEKKLDLTEPS